MKKMRRLIPAIAMLLVSAVMLSTASFAWFTLNDEVTASGMQIQAKASGSLLISQAPFDAENLGTADVEINAAVKTLKPMAYYDTKAATATDKMGTLNLVGADYTAGWYKPADNEVSNTITGANNGTYNNPYDTLSQYTFSEEFYIATAGDTMKNADVTITLTSPVHPSTGKTHLAYSVALYVIENTEANAATWADNGNVTFSTAVPTVILHVDEYEDRNTVTLEDLTIPSISGTVDGTAKVGLKVIAYFYVDGELQAPAGDVQNVILGYQHAEPTGAYDALNTYYAFTEVKDDETTTDVNEGLTAGDDLTGLFYKDGNVYKPAYGVYSTTDTTKYFTRGLASLTNDDKDPTKTASLAGKGYYVVSEKQTVQGDDESTADKVETSYVVTVSEPVAVTRELPYSYVRSADIPSSGSFLALSFSAAVAE